MGQSTTVTVLVENKASKKGLRGEHGMAFWVEAGSERVLLDTGHTAEVLLHNARELGIDLASVSAVVLSHGHCDHTGGLWQVLRQAGDVPLFLHPGAPHRKFVKKTDGSVLEAGMPLSADGKSLASLFPSLTWTTQPTPVTSWLRVTGEVPRTSSFEDAGGAFFQDADCKTSDPIADDQAVFFDTPDGTVVLLGCGHAGVVNSLQYVQQLTAGRTIHAVIGGMHLVDATEHRIERTVEALRELDVRIIAPAHCTGGKAQKRMESAFPDRWQPCLAGTRFEFPAT